MKLVLALLLTFTAVVSAKTKIACVGDSITFGAGVAARERLNYPAQLGHLLGESYEVKNFGVNGSTMLNKGDKPYSKQKAYTASLAYQPDIVIIKLGTNDSKPQNWKFKATFKEDTAKLIQSYTSLASKPRIILCQPIPVVQSRWSITEQITRGEVAPLIAAAAIENKVECIDLHLVFDGHSKDIPDGVHPNSFGAERIARSIYQHLTKHDYLATPYNPAAHPAPSAEYRGGPAGWGGGIWWDQLENINKLTKENQDIELIFFGDSISQSWTGPHKRLAQKGGKRPIDKHFADKWKTASFGISGDRTEHLLFRLENGNFDGLNPKAVVLMIGVNNLLTANHNADQITGGITALVKKLNEKLPSTEVILLGPFPSGQNATDPRRVTIAQIQQNIAPLGKRDHVTYLDLAPAFTNTDGTLNSQAYSGDKIHLKRKGYEIWAKALLPTLEKVAPTRRQQPSQASIQLSIVNDGGLWEPNTPPASVGVEHFSIPKGDNLEVTLWASSPMLYNPTNMDIDYKGRIWVAEAVNYRRKARRRPEGDRIVVLQDTNSDGKADKSHTFVQDPSIQAPLGVSVFDNKVVVPMPPNLLVFTDVDRNLKFDPKVDKKEVLMSGFNALQHDHSLHSVTHGPDGKWYFNNGNCGAIFTDKSGKTFNMNGVYRGGGGKWFADNNKLNGKKSDDGFLWTSGFGVRVNPDGTEAEITGHGFRNSYEHSVNSFGDSFQNDNDDAGSCRNSYILEYGSAGFFTRDGQQKWNAVQRPGQPIPQAHWRQADPGTFDAGDIYGLGSPTGNVFYENGALGKEWIGSYLACEPARNTIFAYQPETEKATFSMERFDFVTSNTKKEFIGGDGTKRIAKITSDTNKTILFRPSDIAVGPDGAIYITDWYDGRVGGHATIDDSCSGAIYRIAPKGFKSQPPRLDIETTEGQIGALKSPAVNVRHIGFTKLKAKGAEAYEAVVKLLDDSNPYIRARAIYLLPHLGAIGLKHTKELLKSDDTQTQLVAYRALRRAKVKMLPFAKMFASHSSDAIRRDVALSLRHYSADETKDIFVELAKHVDHTDKNSIEAIGLGAENKENAIWSSLKAAEKNQAPEKWSDKFAKLTWRLWPSAAVPDLATRAMSSAVSPDQQALAAEALAFIDDKSAVEAMLTLASDDSPVKAQAVYWLLTRGTGSWANFNIKGDLKERGIYDPEKIVVNEMKLPMPPKESALPPVAEILKLKGNAEKGKAAIMRCVQCHSVNGVGVNYGPLLAGWGQTQSREAIINAIRNPSAGIAHGYKGREVILKDGKVIHGLVTLGDPTIVTSMGGVRQMIPKNHIQKINDMKRSLMLSADQLGLSAQDIADITSYMQQWTADGSED
jgi:putative membrane-bound dehydrogenase-like protein